MEFDTSLYKMNDLTRGNFDEQLGAAASLCSSAESYKSFSIHSLEAWIIPPIRHGQVKFFHTHKGVPVGFITWAHFSKDTELKLLSNLSFLPQLCEWNEGDNLWIMNIVSIDNSFFPIINHIKENMFLSVGEIKFLGRSRKATSNKLRSYKRDVSEHR